MDLYNDPDLFHLAIGICVFCLVIIFFGEIK